MANLYGVANAPLILGMYNAIGAADIVCPASTETNVVASLPQIAPSQGFFSPIAWISLAISLGATAPNTMTAALRVGAGADVAQVGFAPLLLVAGNTVYMDYCLVGPAQQTPWYSPGSILNISLNPQAQPVTLRFQGTWVTMGLVRAPDS